MRAQVLKSSNNSLELQEVKKPLPKDNQLLLKVKACGICRTDLHIKYNELENPSYPIILGHQIVGIVEEIGKNVSGFKIGDRVGVPWLANTCGKCEYCISQKENLCEKALYTGYTLNGGLAEYAVSYADYTFHLPKDFSDEKIAPLLCAGLIGYRAYKKANPESSLGLYGFGSAAHILTQLAVFEKKKVYAFTKEEDLKGQKFAKDLGAVWAGASEDFPPEKLDAVIIFAPDGKLVPQALKVLKKGGRCICAGIHMSDIPSFPYEDLWNEKRIESVANLTREDGKEFFSLVEKANIKTTVTTYPLEKSNKALEDLEMGKINGSVVVLI